MLRPAPKRRAIRPSSIVAAAHETQSGFRAVDGVLLRSDAYAGPTNACRL